MVNKESEDYKVGFYNGFRYGLNFAIAMIHDADINALEAFVHSDEKYLEKREVNKRNETL